MIVYGFTYSSICKRIQNKHKLDKQWDYWSFFSKMLKNVFEIIQHNCIIIESKAECIWLAQGHTDRQYILENSVNLWLNIFTIILHFYPGINYHQFSTNCNLKALKGLHWKYFESLSFWSGKRWGGIQGGLRDQGVWARLDAWETYAKDLRAKGKMRKIYF